MKVSAWNQYCNHIEIINLSPEKVYELLMNHYEKSSNSFKVFNERFPERFSFCRGNTLFSIFSIGSELWCKHLVEVDIKEVDDGKSQVCWKINLKLFGLQAGSNAIIKECQNVLKQYA